VWPGGVSFVSACLHKWRMIMIRKFTPALAVALVLASASLASAASTKSQQVRQQPRQPSVMLLEDGAYARGSAASVNRNAVEENYIDKQNVWR
jgi:hypothetical protein